MNRKRLLLAALAGLLLMSLVYAFWAMPRQKQAPPGAAATRPAVKAKVAGKPGKLAADRLHLGLLTQTPQPFPDAGRDIFRFKGGWAPSVEAPVVTAPPVEVVPPPPPPPPTPEEILQQKVAGYTFLGFLDKGGKKTVFLSNAGELFLVKAGERFGKYKELQAQEINATELVVRSVKGPETVRVKLIEKEVLKPAMIGSGSPDSGSAPGDMSTELLQGGSENAPTPRIPRRRRGPPPEVQEEAAEEVKQDVQPPDDGVKQEEPLKEGIPAGEGNGNTE